MYIKSNVSRYCVHIRLFNFTSAYSSHVSAFLCIIFMFSVHVISSQQTIGKMTLTNLLALNTPTFPTYYNLTIFICRLFIDGNFHTAHIIHNHNSFDGQVVFDIQSTCSEPIPWVITDVNQSFELPWTSNEPNDRILQLIFFDPDDLPKTIRDLMNVFVYYRLFVLSATDETQVQRQISSLNKVKLTSNSSSLIVHRSVDDGSVCVHSSILGEEVNENNNRDISLVSPFKQDQMINAANQNLFDLTFGINEQSRLMVINYFLSRAHKQNSPENRIYEVWDGLLFSINYYQSSLQANFINMSTNIFGSFNVKHQIVQQEMRKFYKELTTTYDPIDAEQM